MYNRVDKISINNNRIVTATHAGRTFGLAQAKIDDKALDTIV